VCLFTYDGLRLFVCLRALVYVCWFTFVCFVYVRWFTFVCLCVLVYLCLFVVDWQSVMNRMHVISIPYSLMKVNPLSWIQKVHTYKGKACLPGSGGFCWGGVGWGLVGSGGVFYRDGN
jgi:hypothetical protein